MSVILRQSKSDASCLETWAQLAIKCPQIFKRLWSSFVWQKNLQVVAFSHFWMDCVKRPKVSLTPYPSLANLPWIIKIKIDSLAIFQVNCKMLHTGKPFMNGKFQESPNCFTWANVSGQFMVCDLIKFVWPLACLIFNTDDCHITGFSHIFADIFDTADRGTDLHIQVSIACFEKELVMGNNPWVVNFNNFTLDLFFKRVTTINFGSSSLGWERILTHLCLFDQWPWVLLGTFTLVHTGRVSV